LLAGGTGFKILDILLLGGSEGYKLRIQIEVKGAQELALESWHWRIDAQKLALAQTDYEG
jgi:hypothetical protein